MDAFNFSRDPRKSDLFVSYNRSYTSKYIDHTLKVYSYWLKYLKDEYNIILLANCYENKFIEKFCSYVGIFDGYVKLGDPKYNDWNSYREYFSNNIETLKEQYNPQKFIEIGGHLNTIFKRGKEHKWDIAMKENKNLKFLSVKKCAVINLQNIIFCKTFQLKYNQFLIDSQECDLSKFSEMKEHPYERFFGYKSQKINFSFHPFLKIYYSENQLEIEKKEKDFVIGFAILTPDRKWLSDYYDFFNSLPGSNSIYLKDKYKDINTFISKESYIEVLKNSKYTLMLPPYDDDFFSMIRFLESLALDVIPLIHNTVFCEEVQDSQNLKEITIGSTIDLESLDMKRKSLLLQLKKFFISKEPNDIKEAINLI